jgi:hypothetical protein
MEHWRLVLNCQPRRLAETIRAEHRPPAQAGSVWALRRFRQKVVQDTLLFFGGDVIEQHQRIAHLARHVGAHLFKQQVGGPLVERGNQNGCFANGGGNVGHRSVEV